jgi:hypothetical protein
MNKYLLIFFYAFTFFTANAQLNYSLEDIIIKARGQSPRAKQAETRRENRFWQYKYYRSNYNPQLRLQGNTLVTIEIITKIDWTMDPSFFKNKSKHLPMQI